MCKSANIFVVWSYQCCPGALNSNWIGLTCILREQQHCNRTKGGTARCQLYTFEYHNILDPIRTVHELLRAHVVRSLKAKGQQ